MRVALTARCHVLAEKPLAPTAETTNLLAVAASAERLLVPVHQYGFQPGVLRLMASWSLLGRITHLEVACASAGAQGGSAECADAVAAGILPHFLGLSRQLLDITLAEQQWSLVRPRPGEWRAQCREVSIGYLMSMATRPTFAELSVLGKRASARADLFHGFAVFDKSPVSQGLSRPRDHFEWPPACCSPRRGSGATRHQLEPAYPGLSELVRRVHLAAMGQGTSPILPAETLDIAEARDRLIALARPDLIQ